jgi:hypothetical protein
MGGVAGGAGAGCRRLTGAGAKATVAAMAIEGNSSESSKREAHAEATLERLFGPRDTGAPDDDPELMAILRGFIFGDIFNTAYWTIRPAS